jgi:hypothetical protein
MWFRMTDISTEAIIQFEQYDDFYVSSGPIHNIPFNMVMDRRIP